MFSAGCLLLGLLCLLGMAIQGAFLLFELVGYYTAIRVLLHGALLLAAVWAAFRFDWPVLLARFEVVAVARRVERCNDMRGRLVSAAEFSHRFAPDSLAAAFRREVAESLGEPPFPSRRLLNRLGIFCFILGVALVLQGALFPRGMGRTWRNLLAADAAAGIRYTLHYPRRIPQNGPFRLRVESDAYRVAARLEHDGEQYRRQLQTGDNGFVLELPRVRRNLKLQLELEKPGLMRRVGPLQIEVLQDLFVTQLDFHLRYPAYLGQAPRVLRAPPYLELPQGTQVTVVGRANTPLIAARLVSTNFVLPAQVSGNTFRCRFTARRSLGFRFFLKTEQGMTNRDPVYYQLAVQQDRPPSIVLHSPGGDSTADRSLQVPLLYSVRDDSGIAAVRLHFAILHGNYREKGRESLPRPPAGAEDTDTRLSWVWDVNQLPVSPGQSIVYYLEATDRAGQSARTKEQRLRLPAFRDLLQRADRTADSALDRLRKMVKERKESLQRLDEAQRRERAGGEDKAFRRKKEVERLRRSHARQLKQLEKLDQELRRQRRQLQDQRLFSPQTLEKIRQVRKYMEQLKLDSMPRYNRKLENMLRKLDKNSLRNLQQMEKQMSKSLDKLLAALKEMMRMRLLESLSNLIKEMKHQARRIDMKLKQRHKLETSRREYRSLEELSRYLQRATRRLQQEMPGQKDKRDLEQLRKDLQAPQGMPATRKARDQHGKGQFNASRRQLQGFQAQLKKMEQRMQGILSRSQNSAMARILGTIQVLAADFLTLSQELEGLQDDFQELMLRRTRRSYPFKRRANSLLSRLGGIKRVITGKAGLYGRTMQGFLLSDGGTEQEMAQAAALVQEAIANIQNVRLYSARYSLRSSLGSANRVVIRLLRLLTQLKKAMQQSQGGRGNASLKQQLQAMAEAQQRLDARLQRLMGKAAQGKLSAAEEEYLRMLALQQQAIRQALEKMRRGGGKQGFLGDMEQLIKEMRALEKQLRSGNTDRKLLEREKRILKRLLQATRAMRSRGLKDKRKAEQPDAQADKGKAGRSQIPEALLKTRRYLRSFRGNRSLSPAQRVLIKRYYRLLLQQTTPEGNADHE